MIIVSNIKDIDKAIHSIDVDRTVFGTLKLIAVKYGSEFNLVFANSGNQNNDSMPEKPICAEVGFALIDGLGDKIQTISWLLQKSKKPNF